MELESSLLLYHKHDHIDVMSLCLTFRQNRLVESHKIRKFMKRIPLLLIAFSSKLLRVKRMMRPKTLCIFLQQILCSSSIINNVSACLTVIFSPYCIYITLSIESVCLLALHSNTLIIHLLVHLFFVLVY